MDKEKILNMPPAGFLIRLLANLTDNFILFLFPNLFLFLVNLGNKNLKELIITLIWFILLFLLFGGIVKLLYFSYTTSIKGGTLGKMMAGLTVTDENGNKISLKRSLFRHLIGYMISGLLFGFGFLSMVWDKNKQGWHDQLSGTFVKRTGKSVIMIVFVFLLMLFIDSCLLVVNIQRLVTNPKLQQEIQLIQNLPEPVDNTPFPSLPTDNEI